MSDQALSWVTEFREAMRLSVAIGCKFWVNGADVDIDGISLIPEAIEKARQSGYLYSWLGADDADREAITFCRQLDVEPVLVKAREQAIAAVKEMSGAAHLGADIETTPKREFAKPRRPIAINGDGSLGAIQRKHHDKAGLDPHRAEIASLQLYGGGSKCFVFRGEALRLMLGSRWLREQRIVCHNSSFELAFLRHHTTPIEGVKGLPIECTLQGGGLVIGVGHGGEKRSLANVASAILNLNPPKALQSSAWGAPRLSPGQIAYAASDAVLAWRLWPKLNAAITARRCTLAYQLQRNAIPAVADMGLRGLGFDCNKHALQVDGWSRQLSDARHQFVEMAGRAPPSKPAEVRELITGVAGDLLPNWPRSKKTGELSIKGSHLKRLITAGVAGARPLIAMLAMQKLLSTFGPKLADSVSPATGRIHCSYNIGGSKAGRFSAEKPNLQQLPASRAPEFRRCIVAAPGNVLISCDWNQVEMRAAAWLSKDQALTRVYAEGRDLHSETASAIARVLPGLVTPAQRQAAKPVNYGAIYGIGPVTLAEDAFDNYGIEMTEPEAKGALVRFFETYRGYDKWRWDHWRLVKLNKRVVVPVSGRTVEGAWEPEGRVRFPQACNIPIQGMCADAMLRAIALMGRRLPGAMVACLHDEILLEVSEGDADRAKVALEEVMVEAFSMTFPGAPTNGVAKAGVGKDWLEAKG
jgi:DNA polymerase I-like protein with 3'-5' exonuclease and polymerase domains